MNRRKALWLVLAALVLAALGIAVGVAVHQASQPDTGPAYGRTSAESAKANYDYLDYVRMGNPELDSEPNGNLLVVGYNICAQLHSFSELTLVNMADIEYTGAGQRIYDGATQYLCETGQ